SRSTADEGDMCGPTFFPRLRRGLNPLSTSSPAHLRRINRDAVEVPHWRLAILVATLTPSCKQTPASYPARFSRIPRRISATVSEEINDPHRLVPPSTRRGLRWHGLGDVADDIVSRRLRLTVQPCGPASPGG